MVVSVLIVFIILYLYLKYPQIFSFKNEYINGRYIRLESDSTTKGFGFSNFIILDNSGSVITPSALSVNPAVSDGNGRTPKASTATDLTDIVLVQVASGTTSDVIPYIEYDLGMQRQVSKIIIINRKNILQKMQRNILRILDSDRNQLFEQKLSESQDIYSINIS